MAKYVGCKVMAEAIQSIMAAANFLGLINQEDGAGFRQFEPSKIEGDDQKAVLCFKFGKQFYKAEITFDDKE